MLSHFWDQATSISMGQVVKTLSHTMEDIPFCGHFNGEHDDDVHHGFLAPPGGFDDAHGAPEAFAEQWQGM